MKIGTEVNSFECDSRVMTGRSNEAEIKPKINCARKKKSHGLSDRVDFFATTVQKKKEARIQVGTRPLWDGNRWSDRPRLFRNSE